MTHDEYHNKVNEQIARDPTAYISTPIIGSPIPGLDVDYIERKVVSDAIDMWIKQRQKGFDLKHDLAHRDGELSRAASAHALLFNHDDESKGRFMYPYGECRKMWPWQDGYKINTRRDNLLTAVGFLLSEIARHDAIVELELRKIEDQKDKESL